MFMLIFMSKVLTTPITLLLQLNLFMKLLQIFKENFKKPLERIMQNILMLMDGSILLKKSLIFYTQAMAILTRHIMVELE